jgi:hypothetical protein
MPLDWLIVPLTCILGLGLAVSACVIGTLDSPFAPEDEHDLELFSEWSSSDECDPG